MAFINHIKPINLYRYRSVAELDREIRTIERHYLYCSHFEDLNDPLEGHFRTSRQLRESGKHRAVREQIIGKKNELRICSFSEINNHHVMWAHYADQFRGICVSYRLSRLLNGLGSRIEFTRMTYREKLPTVRESKRPREEAIRVLSSKHDRWAYENEWRMFSDSVETSYLEVDCVSRVFLGSRMEHDKKERLTSKLKSLNISVSEMQLRKYSIEFESIFESRRRR